MAKKDNKKVEITEIIRKDNRVGIKIKKNPNKTYELSGGALKFSDSLEEGKAEISLDDWGNVTYARNVGKDSNNSSKSYSKSYYSSEKKYQMDHKRQQETKRMAALNTAQKIVENQLKYGKFGDMKKASEKSEITKKVLTESIKETATELINFIEGKGVKVSKEEN